MSKNLTKKTLFCLILLGILVNANASNEVQIDNTQTDTSKDKKIKIAFPEYFLYIFNSTNSPISVTLDYDANAYAGFSTYQNNTYINGAAYVIPAGEMGELSAEGTGPFSGTWFAQVGYDFNSASGPANAEAHVQQQINGDNAGFVDGYKAANGNNNIVYFVTSGQTVTNPINPTSIGAFVANETGLTGAAATAVSGLINGVLGQYLRDIPGSGISFLQTSNMVVVGSYEN